MDSSYQNKNWTAVGNESFTKIYLNGKENAVTCDQYHGVDNFKNAVAMIDNVVERECLLKKLTDLNGKKIIFQYGVFCSEDKTIFITASKKEQKLFSYA